MLNNPLAYIAVAIAAGLCIVGCDPHAYSNDALKMQVNSSNEDDPVAAQFKDCTMADLHYKSSNGETGWVKAVRCPNSTTTATSRVGKTTQHVIVVDGVKYQEVAKDVPQ